MDEKLVEVIWAAGFYDGEGYCAYHKVCNYVHLTVGQNELVVLQRFHKAVGVGTIYEPARNQKHYCWRTTNSKDFIIAVDLLWPFLSEPKRRQIIEQTQKRRDQLLQRGKTSGEEGWCPRSCLRDP